MNFNNSFSAAFASLTSNEVNTTVQTLTLLRHEIATAEKPDPIKGLEALAIVAKTSVVVPVSNNSPIQSIMQSLLDANQVAFTRGNIAATLLAAEVVMNHAAGDKAKYVAEMQILNVTLNAITNQDLILVNQFTPIQVTTIDRLASVLIKDLLAGGNPSVAHLSALSDKIIEITSPEMGQAAMARVVLILTGLIGKL